MTSVEARNRVSALRVVLDKAMRAVSTPEPDWEKYMLSMLCLSSRADSAALDARHELKRLTKEKWHAD